MSAQHMLCIQVQSPSISVDQRIEADAPWMELVGCASRSKDSLGMEAAVPISCIECLTHAPRAGQTVATKLFEWPGAY